MDNRGMGRTLTCLRVVAIACLLGVGGCVDRTVKGNNVAEYGFSWWVGTLVVLGGLLAMPLGWVLRRSSRRLMVVGLVLGPVLLLLIGPPMFLDGVTVDDRHFEGRYGVWFSPTRFNVAYADLDHINVVTWQERSRRGGTRTKQRLDCVGKAGGTTTIQLGDLLKYARNEMLDRAHAAGVRVFEREE
jgi:hypothetical protein